LAVLQLTRFALLTKRECAICEAMRHNVMSAPSIHQEDWADLKSFNTRATHNQNSEGAR
jgi:hypothetical protein